LNLADRPPSTQWAALKCREAVVAWVWFKPDGAPFTIRFCIPRESFHDASIRQLLTLENLLRSVGTAPEEIESDPESNTVLSPPAEGEDHRYLDVRLPPPSEAAAALSTGETGDGETHNPEPTTETVDPIPTAGQSAAQGDVSPVSEATWQQLEVHWKAILGIEANIETVRRSTANIVNELETLLQATLSIEERTDATRADITNWERAKKRVPFVLPKLNDFVHRAVWAATAPERKQLETLYKEHIEPQIPFSNVATTLNDLEALQKTRQTLLAVGHTACQEGRSIATDAQGALQTLKSNAATNARNRRNAARGGKFFKDVRKMSGL
jgi:hypothetical protein